MADDWQVGDLALCIRQPEGPLAYAWTVKVGGIYTVCEVIFWESELWGLNFAEDPYLDDVSCYDPECFRKINPHAPDVEDEETIRLLNSAPCNVPSHVVPVPDKEQVS